MPRIRHAHLGVFEQDHSLVEIVGGPDGCHDNQAERSKGDGRSELVEAARLEHVGRDGHEGPVSTGAGEMPAGGRRRVGRLPRPGARVGTPAARVGGRGLLGAAHRHETTVTDEMTEHSIK
eukprot:scaffold55331_cov23-Tisochrysis_lutea.AAC.3